MRHVIRTDSTSSALDSTGDLLTSRSAALDHYHHLKDRRPCAETDPNSDDDEDYEDCHDDESVPEDETNLSGPLHPDTSLSVKQGAEPQPDEPRPSPPSQPTQLLQGPFPARTPPVPRHRRWREFLQLCSGRFLPHARSPRDSQTARVDSELFEWVQLGRRTPAGSTRRSHGAPALAGGVCVGG